MHHYFQSKLQGKRPWGIRQESSSSQFASLECLFTSEYILSSHEASNLEPNSLQIVYVPLDSNTHNQYFHGFKVTFWPPFGGTGTTIGLLINPSQKSPVSQQGQHDSPAWGQSPPEVSSHCPPSTSCTLTPCSAFGSVVTGHPCPRAAIADVTDLHPRPEQTQRFSHHRCVSALTWSVNGQLIKLPSQSFVRNLLNKELLL